MINSEKELRRLIEEIVAEKLGELGLLTEMALKRKEYKSRLDNLLPQVIENLCLVLYRTFTGTETNKKHWRSELSGHLYTITRLNLKDNDTANDRLKAIMEVIDENDFFLPKTILLVIMNKFDVEGINADDKFVMDSVAFKCIECLKTLVVMIAKKDVQGENEFILTL